MYPGYNKIMANLFHHLVEIFYSGESVLLNLILKSIGLKCKKGHTGIRVYQKIFFSFCK